MRILQVIPVFSPPKLFGGSQRVVYLVSKQLSKRGHEVVVYTSDMSSLKERVSKYVESIDGFTITHFKNVSPSWLSKVGLLITPRMEKCLKTEIKNFDIIHIHEARSFQHLVVWRLARKRGVPYVVQAHGNLSPHFGGFPRRIYDEIFGKKVLRGASKVIAVSKIEALDYARFGVNEEKVVFIPNPIDIDEFSNHGTRGAFREKYNIDSDSKMILFMGRIHAIKGIDVLLYAFAKMIKDSKVNATLVVAGPDDGFLKKCIGIVKTYNISNVIFPGQLDDMERINAYIDADVVVLPSRYETFPITILEAYACGKPVIASDVGGLRDLVIDKETGILVKPGNVNELSRALLVSLSEDNVAKWGLRAKEFVKRFSVGKVVDKLEQVYVNVVRQNA